MIVSLEMSVSPNGYIAREDGREDWLSSDNWKEFLRRTRSTRNIVMGRNTYELVTELYPDYNFDTVQCDKKIIVSRSMQESPSPDYEVVSSPEAAIEKIKELGFEELLLIGGGKLNTSFLERGLVDQITVTYEPHIIGRGRVVMSPGDFEYKLKLKRVDEKPSGHVVITYEVMR